MNKIKYKEREQLSEMINVLKVITFKKQTRQQKMAVLYTLLPSTSTTSAPWYPEHKFRILQILCFLHRRLL